MMATNRTNRFLAAFVAWAYFVGSLLLFFHFAADRHSVCVEHQTVHHVAHASEDEPPSGSELPQVRSVSLEDDEHCELLQFFQSSTLALKAAPPSIPSKDVLEVARLRAPAEPAAQAIARWRIAPKQSPPV